MKFILKLEYSYSENDRRKSYLYLTDKGKFLLEKIIMLEMNLLKK